MQNSVGPTLREARNRRKIGLSEVEAATKIRLRYLRAMENEEWDLLPGGSYTRSFIRTYASFLGLDGERLADEYRRGSEPAPGDPAPASPRPPRRRPRLSSRVWTAIVTLGMLAILVAIGLSSGGGTATNRPPQSGPLSVHRSHGAQRLTRPAPRRHRAAGGERRSLGLPARSLRRPADRRTDPQRRHPGRARFTPVASRSPSETGKFL